MLSGKLVGNVAGNVCGIGIAEYSDPVVVSGYKYTVELSGIPVDVVSHPER